MTNRTIANTFNQLARIMELHGENAYKIRSYQNAYLQVRKLQQPLSEMSDQEIGGIKGVGKAISAKIRELLDTGKMQTLQKYLDQTPSGVVEMLNIKGFGPKKIKTLWDQLKVDNIVELLYACNENRLVELKGFGQKTQEDLRKKLEYYLKSRNQFHYAKVEPEAEGLLALLAERLPNARIALTGAIRRRAIILDSIELLIAADTPPTAAFDEEKLRLEQQDGNRYIARLEEGLLVQIYHCAPQEFGSKLFRYTATDDFLNAFIKRNPDLDFKSIPEEATIFERAQLPIIPPEVRESAQSLDRFLQQPTKELVAVSDIKGIIHSHTTYSDGLHTLEEMARYTQAQGYEYIGITDHSKSAFYANGLSAERVLEQFAAIDALNAQLDGFRIFKGIESDILNDGSLDYPPDLLDQFDFIIASVHSNLKMDKTKATHRLIKAIESPFTTILGHPTGRLLLSREGYPIDHQKVIDACAANKVSIELNANPYRLDLDWKWIPYALDKGVKISINPDAHSKEGIGDVRFGVLAARKGGLRAPQCLNSLSAAELAVEWGID